MALPPKFTGHRLTFSPASASSSTVSPHTLEFYVDYVCPFSSKLFNTLYTSVLPALQSSPPSAPLNLVFRQQVQPWHPSSTLTHEAALAVLRLTGSDPSKFYAFSAALFKDQKSYFDVNVVNEPRNATYRRLAKLAKESVGLDEEEVYKLLVVPDQPGEDGSLNVGNAVTNELKVLVKMARLVGVHVSPTVIFDGVIAGEISSSWTKEQWVEWIGKNVA
ncbi:thioredoxin-like protein [Podospora aff. communis PSN243]|uniref:Thioredoxin-like protein n=1 Tax=Podospora aff. communis PSN243 TaxID=3040156 RepID=A0AAV9GI23_9PEZI|nr:thioredoxin-like protein [Podospora aff. communis PSN243]